MFDFLKRGGDTSHGKTKKSSSIFELSMKKSLYVIWSIAGLAVVALIYFMVSYYMGMARYNKEAASYLPLPRNHQTTALFSGDRLVGVPQHSMYSMIDAHHAFSDEFDRIQQSLDAYRVPFDAFLHTVYLPSLNIWKNPFLKTIDTTMMGGAFLEHNPYTDIALINQWTNFFKSMGSDAYNKIESIVVDAIVEEGEFFSIPIRVTFVAPSRRAFLFLLDKLSLTSDRNNIMLVNEFFSHLWAGLYEIEDLDMQLEEVLSTDLDQVMIISDDNRDAMIGYVLAGWRDGLIESVPFLTNDVLKNTVRRASGCSDSDERSVCAFAFREKFRTIPRLAYGLAYEGVSAEDLQYFIDDIPPLLVLDSFTFDKVYNEGIVGESLSYKVELSMSVYGQGISSDEVMEIADELGKVCFGDRDTPMSISYAQDIVREDLLEDVDPAVVSRQRSKDLLEMQSLLSLMAADYDSLSSYQKIIRLFETYRMMDDMLFCE